MRNISERTGQIRDLDFILRHVNDLNLPLAVKNDEIVKIPDLGYGAKMTVKREKVSVGDTTVPVVVLYTYHYGQLGVLRSFGRLGIAVHGVDPNPWSPGLFSRYCQEKILVGC